MIQAKVIADSKNQFGDRITTMVITMPRIVLAEFNTHRMFSRNSASSRAIPFKKMVEAVKTNPFIPIAWQKDHKGMQGTEYFTSESDINVLKEEWLRGRDEAIKSATVLNNCGLTKQLCNRKLEPYMWHTVIVTATEWENFFYLRCPQYVIEGINGNKPFRSKKDVYKRLQNHDSFHLKLNDFTDLDWLKMNISQAEIHIQAVAEAMWDALNESTPKELKAGEWHIPFGDNIENVKSLQNVGSFRQESAKYMNYETALKVKIATARCARVSYTVVGEEGKEPNYENDIRLHDRLVESGHWSPAEHCAKAMDKEEYFNNEWSGNFKGFIQYRKTFKGENKV